MAEKQHIQLKIFLKTAEGWDKEKKKEIALIEGEDKSHEAQVSVVICESFV